MPRKHLNIGNKIQSRRKAMGLSQEELAQRTGVSRQSVTKWETGQSAPDLDRLVQLADLLGVSLDYLLRADMESLDAEPLPGPETPPPSVRASSRLPFAVASAALLVPGLLGLAVLWALSVAYPVQLTDWDGTRYTGLWGFLIRHDVRFLFWAAVGLTLAGSASLAAWWRQGRKVRTE
ncbi:MAG: helix-turn-helix transcriptional regulator [Bilophila sp.]